jgi:hypothetical protein
MIAHPARWPMPIVAILGLMLSLMSCFTSVEPAFSCHIFSVWHYPQKQRCGARARRFVALAPQPQPRQPARVATPAPPPAVIEIPLPDLAGIWDAAPNEEQRGRMLLHALLR